MYQFPPQLSNALQVTVEKKNGISRKSLHAFRSSEQWGRGRELALRGRRGYSDLPAEMKATATLEDTNLYYFRSFAIIPTHSTCKAWRNYPDTFETLFLFFFSDECVTNWLSSYFCFKLNLKGYCHDNFTAFSSKLWWNYDPEPLFKTRTLLQPQEEDIKRFSKEEQTRVFFWRYFPLTMAKLENVILTFSSCSPYMCHPWPSTTISSLSSLLYETGSFRFADYRWSKHIFWLFTF